MKKNILMTFIVIVICSSIFAFDNSDLNIKEILEGVWVSEGYVDQISENYPIEIKHNNSYKTVAYDSLLISFVNEKEFLGIWNFSGNSTFAIMDINQIDDSRLKIELCYLEDLKTGNKLFKKYVDIMIVDNDEFIADNELIGNYCDYQGKKVHCYKISGPSRSSERKVIVNDNKVSLRIKPNLECKKWGLLNSGDVATIKDRTNEKFVIDGESWYWYKIDHPKFPDAWVYGKYLDMNGDKYSTHKVFTFEIPQPENNSVVIIRSMNFIFFDKYAKKVESHKNEYQRYLSEQLRKYSFEDILCNKFEIQEKLKENINKDFGLKIEYVTFGRVELEHR